MELLYKKLKNLKNLEKIIAEIETKIDRFEYTKEEKYIISIAAEELATNALFYTTKQDSAAIKYTIKKTEIRLKVKNKAEPFDWEQYTAPEYLKKINAKAQVPCRGINMTNKLMDELNYKFKKGYVIASAKYRKKEPEDKK